MDFTLIAPGARFGFIQSENMAQENMSDDPQEPTYCTACQAQQSGKGEED